MPRALLAVLLASLCGIAASTVIARDASVLQGRAVAPPESRVEGRDALDAALAAAVIGAVGAQFQEADVSVTLGRVDVTPASLQDRTLSGHGRIRLGSDPTWIPFGFEALYDTASASVSYPRLVLGSTRPGRELGAGSTLAHELATQVRAGLRREFEGQPVAFDVERVVSHPAGQRFVHLKATGTVDFGSEGEAPARIDALYDSRARRWVRVGYDLVADDGGAPAMTGA